jgi:hypothetical protein
LLNETQKYTSIIYLTVFLSAKVVACFLVVAVLLRRIAVALLHIAGLLRYIAGYFEIIAGFLLPCSGAGTEAAASILPIFACELDASALLRHIAVALLCLAMRLPEKNALQ